MSLYQLNDSKLAQIREKPFKLERELQQLTEENLETLFGLEFISSEFAMHDLRIDTLAFNPESNSCVIIEYKRDQGFTVIDQGFSYLSTLLNNQADFVLEYNRKKKENRQKEDFDWSQTRVMFLSRSFTNYQQNAVNFKDLPIELWEVVKYDNDVILYNKLKASGASASIKTVGKTKEIANISKELRAYTERDVVPKGSKAGKLYDLLKEKIAVINPNLVPYPTKFYVGFRLPDERRNLFAVWASRNKISVDFNRSQPKDFKDPEKRVFYRNRSFEQYNQHISRMEVSGEKEVEYAIYLIGQLYDRFLKI